MIGQRNRFHGRGGIRKAYAGGKTVRAGALSLKYVPSPQRKAYRAAVVVSKKVSKSAVVRNRIRRRVYEHVRILSSGLTGPFDLIITVYDQQIATLPTQLLADEVAALCKKAKIVHTTPTPRDIVKAKEKD